MNNAIAHAFNRIAITEEMGMTSKIAAAIRAHSPLEANCPFEYAKEHESQNRQPHPKATGMAGRFGFRARRELLAIRRK